MCGRPYPCARRELRDVPLAQLPHIHIHKCAALPHLRATDKQASGKFYDVSHTLSQNKLNLGIDTPDVEWAKTYGFDSGFDNSYQSRNPWTTDVDAHSYAVEWVDYDLDGDLDLYIANGDGNGGGKANYLYRNDIHVPPSGSSKQGFTKITNLGAIVTGESARRSERSRASSRFLRHLRSRSRTSLAPFRHQGNACSSLGRFQWRRHAGLDDRQRRCVMRPAQLTSRHDPSL